MSLWSTISRQTLKKQIKYIEYHKYYVPFHNCRLNMFSTKHLKGFEVFCASYKNKRAELFSNRVHIETTGRNQIQKLLSYCDFCWWWSNLNLPTTASLQMSGFTFRQIVQNTGAFLPTVEGLLTIRSLTFT